VVVMASRSTSMADTSKDLLWLFIDTSANSTALTSCRDAKLRSCSANY
jgi:hypothetical protein